MIRSLVLLLSTYSLFVCCSTSSSGDAVHADLDYLSGSGQFSEQISHQNVEVIYEDHLGYIWLGTARGLNRFNGTEYLHYYQTPDSTSLTGDWILSIKEDREKYLWVGTKSGICRLDNQNSFQHFEIEGDDKQVKDIYENSEGEILIRTTTALYRLNPSNRNFEKMIDFSTPYTFIDCFLDTDDNIWTVNETEIGCHSGNNLSRKETYPLDFVVKYSYLDRNGRLWLTSEGKILTFDTRKRQFSQAPFPIAESRLSGSAIKIIMEYDENLLLLITEESNMFMYNDRTGDFFDYWDIRFPFHITEGDIPQTVFVDAKKNVWLGTYDHGVILKYNVRTQFIDYKKLKNTSVISIDNDKSGNVWVLTQNNGIYKYYSFWGFSLETITIESKIFDKLSQNNQLLSLYIDSQDNIWITGNGQLLQCRSSAGKLTVTKTYSFNSNLFANSMYLTEDRQGGIWAGCYGELFYYLPKGGSTFETINRSHQSPMNMQAITTLADGKILAAYSNIGLVIIDPSTRETNTIRFPELAEGTDIMPSCLFESSEGIIWVGTLGNGLFKCRQNDTVLESVEGPTCNYISAIVDDGYGNLWITTHDGMGRYDRSSGTTTYYHAGDDIERFQFNNKAALKMQDGYVTVGGTQGLVLFNPIDIIEQSKVPLYFESLSVSNEPVKPTNGGIIDKNLVYRPTIKLNHDQNNFSIGYSALDYSEFSRVRYYYKMDGVDDDWINAQSRKHAFYSNIPYGKRTFHIRVTGFDNNEVLNQTSIDVIVTPMAILSLPAQIAYIVIILVVSIFIYNLVVKLNRNKIKTMLAYEEKEQQERLNEMTMLFFTNISHEFRTPLTMISGSSDLLLNELGTNPKTNRLLNILDRNVMRMLKLINQLLDFNKLENDLIKLKVTPADPLELLNGIVGMFLFGAERKLVNIVLTSSKISSTAWIDSDKLEKIMSNLLSNAIKYSLPGGNIEIFVDTVNSEDIRENYELEENIDIHYLKISVSDNGIGIPEDKLEAIFERYVQIDNATFKNIGGTGIGLYYTRKLVRLHHGAIKAINIESYDSTKTGAVFTFVLPISETSYSEEEKGVQKEPLVHLEKGEIVNSYESLEADIPGESQECKPTILVIDDDSEMTYYLEVLLSPFYKVVTRFDAISGYDIIEKVNPDVIVCDVLMLEVDGYQFCRMVKENISISSIPVILLTAKSSLKDQMEGLNKGADAYVTKPFDNGYILTVIKAQLTRRNKLRELLGYGTNAEKIEEDILSEQDRQFMNSLYQLMETELSNPELNIGKISETLYISHSKLAYKIKALTGDNPKVFFNKYKLNRAAELIKEGKYKISVVADITGFSTPSHFGTLFKKQFGVLPSDYIKRNKS